MIFPKTVASHGNEAFGNNIQPIGKVTEVGKKIDEFSEAFEWGLFIITPILFLSNKKFKLKDPTKLRVNIIAEITYQTCDDRVCLAPNTLEFENKIETKGKKTKQKKRKKRGDNRFHWRNYGSHCKCVGS